MGRLQSSVSNLTLAHPIALSPSCTKAINPARRVACLSTGMCQVSISTVQNPTPVYERPNFALQQAIRTITSSIEHSGFCICITVSLYHHRLYESILVHLILNSFGIALQMQGQPARTDLVEFSRCQAMKNNSESNQRLFVRMELHFYVMPCASGYVRYQPRDGASKIRDDFARRRDELGLGDDEHYREILGSFEAASQFLQWDSCDSSNS